MAARLDSDWRDRLPEVRGEYRFDEPLARYVWFKVGGPADVLFTPGCLVAAGPTAAVNDDDRGKSLPLLDRAGEIQIQLLLPVRAEIGHVALDANFVPRGEADHASVGQ